MAVPLVIALLILGILAVIIAKMILMFLVSARARVCVYIYSDCVYVSKCVCVCM